MMSKYYTSEAIRKLNCTYNIIIGQRSNGKTYDALYHGLEDFVKTGAQFAIVRRWDEDFNKQRGASMFTGLTANRYGENVIARLTDGQWNDVYYYSRRWYFCRFDKQLNKRITCDDPFAYGFSLSATEHDKSTSYNKVKTIIFDEFLTRSIYLANEFVLFMNTVSTIARDRDDEVKIFMLGNTVNQYCPYFEEMGLTRIRQQEPGTIDVYTMGEVAGNHVKIAVEYCKQRENAGKSKKAKTDLFCFDNSRLKMITSGAWEIEVYPHCPVKYKTTEVIFHFFVDFKGDMLHCEVVAHEDLLFIFVHPKTTDLKNTEKDLIYTTDYNVRPNYRRYINKPITKTEQKIYGLFLADKIFYSDNQTGEVMRNYLAWCKSA